MVVAVVSPLTSDQPGDVPTGLDAALDRLPAGTRVFNDYDVGGWMVWRHPDLEHYIDGLVTPYSVRHVDDYGRVVSQAPGWYDVVRSSGAAVALVPSDSAAAAGPEEQGLDGRGHRRRLRAARPSVAARDLDAGAVVVGVVRLHGRDEVAERSEERDHQATGEHRGSG